MTAVALESWRYMSLNQLSQIFGCARETIKARIDNAGVRVSDEKNGHPLYDAKLVYEAIKEHDQYKLAAVKDPEMLPAKERRDWYEGDNARLKNEKERGRLVEAALVHEWMAELVKPGVQLLETLPDILERDYNIDASVIHNIEQRIDVLRNEWASAIEKQCTNHLQS